jgi:hypothetical protein
MPLKPELRWQRALCSRHHDTVLTVATLQIQPNVGPLRLTTFLTTWFHRRSFRHVWLVVGFVGTAACV